MSLSHLTHLVVRQVVNEAQDDRIGQAKKSNTSISNFLSTLVVNLVVFSVLVLLFLILRKSQRRQYAPRTYVGTVSQWNRHGAESIQGQQGFLSWIFGIIKTDDTTILRITNLDGYFFLRYLAKAQLICFVGCLITFPILFPINVTGRDEKKAENEWIKSAGNLTAYEKPGGLDLLAFGNVNLNNRYYAHVFVGYIFFGFVLYTIYRELLHFIAIRQAYMLSPLYRTRISARTVLITSIPEDYMSESALLSVFDNVQRIWINTDTEKLEELVKERDEVAMKLEAGEVKLIKMTDAARRKALNSGAGDVPADVDEGESGSVSAKWLDKKNRPSHKTKFLIGEKVDTIDWSRGKLAELNPQIEEMQNTHRSGQATKLNSAFIEFTSQSAAQIAVQTLAHNIPLHMAPRYIGITPAEVVWSNMGLKPIPRLIKIVAATTFVVALVVFWSIPVAFVGTISQINYLTAQFKWLSWIDKIPKVILGLVTGLLPVVMLAILMALLPIVLRLMAKIAGSPSLSEIELVTQNSYFAFQVVQVFLITTLSSAVSASINSILKNPSIVASLLAQNIPKASNFYIAFMILQGLAISAGALLQIAGLILFKILGMILDNTPRKMWRRWSTLSGLGWGTVFPVYTNLVVIALTYSIIAPLVLGFATVGLGLLWLAYRYNILFVYNTNIDTKGLVYPRALYQTFTGIYLAEICLIGLFALRKAVGPLILQVIFLIFTILFQMGLTSAIEPLLKYLPRNLEDEEDRLAERELELERGVTGTGGVGSSTAPAPASQNEKLESGKEAIADNATPTSRSALSTIPVVQPGLFARFFSPEKYETYHNLRRIIPKPDYEIGYTPEELQDAYYHPSVTAKPAVLWLPRDEAGVSRQECLHTAEVVACSDEGAIVDEKGKIRRVEEQSAPPDWKFGPIY